MLYVKVDRFRKNPWQVRQHQAGDEGLQELAADIQSRRKSRPATKGLLQVPAARLVNSAGAPVAREGYTEERVGLEISEGELYLQLAYGHRRLAAFRSLAEEDSFWAHMPVELVWFDDEEMATAAWSENAARKDLTPLEQARAISLMMDGFGWTQQQAAEKLGLSQPTVANKLRLLKLPIDQRMQVQEGTLSERQALALLPLTELPEAAVEDLPDWRKEDAKWLLEKSGEQTSKEIRAGVKRVVEAATADLGAADFPLGFALETDGVRAATCEACDQRLGQRKSRCADPACFAVRTWAWRRGVLAPISEEVGIPLLDPEVQHGLNYSEVAYFYNEADLGFAREEQCENLRVAWRSGDHFPSVDGHEHTMLVCYHGKGKQCSCKKGRRQEEQAEEIAQENARRRVVKETKAALVEQVAKALDAGETAALRAVLVEVGGYRKQDEHRALEDRGQIVQRVARVVVNGMLYWPSLSAGEVEEKAQAWLQGMGLNGHEGPPADLVEIQRQWARIQGWMEKPLLEREEEGSLSDVAIRGNIDNLNRLYLELLDLVPVGDDEEPMDETQLDELRVLATAIREAMEHLEGMV